jgi:hypothetical protein
MAIPAGIRMAILGGIAGAAVGALSSASVSAASSTVVEGGLGEAVIRGGEAQGLRYLVTASRCDDRLSTEWRHPDGSLVAAEEVELVDGRWARYRLRRANVGQDLRAERRGDVVTITDASRPSHGPVRLTARGTLLAGPELVAFLQARLVDLRAGRALEFQYLLADRGTAVGFVARGRVVGDDTAVTLEAASALFRPFVPKTSFRFTADGGLQQVVGRMLPVLGDAKSQKALDGVLKMSGPQSTCNRKSLS